MLELFNKVSQTNSTREKIELLKGFPRQEELKDVVRLALDPFITFGITDFPEAPDDSDIQKCCPYKVLDQLSKRALTGGIAKETLALALSDYHPDDHEIFRRIIRKDLRCGVGPNIALAVWPGLFPTFDIMRAVKYEKLGKGRYFIEPKIDGLRCVTSVIGKSVTLLSRNGLEFTSSDHLKPQILELVKSRGDCILDGELTSGNFNNSSSAVRRKSTQNDRTCYTIFDYLSMDEWKSPTQPYMLRRGKLESLFGGQDHSQLILPPSYEVFSHEDVLRFFNHFLDKGYEGGMVKRASGLYHKRKHKDWMKVKDVKEVDLTVESIVQGEGKYYGMLGALICKYKGKRVSIGTGISDEEREAWWKNPNLILRKVIEVHYHEETPDGSLRHPRLYRVRWDKDHP